MKKGALLILALGIVAVIAIVMAFAGGASPYVTIEEAKAIDSGRVHLAGDLVKGSVRNDFRNHTLLFRLKDVTGQTIEVIHRGDPPANMGDATKVVAIGGVKNGKFESEKLLIKCPSKYEEESKA
jgi:cytochrome c-type biogenesis protein CcmE